MQVQSETPEICPVCGEDVPRGARACPECGADHKTGWTDDEDQATGVLPDEDFDYEAYIEREFGTGARPAGIRPIWWITAIILVIAFIGVYLFR